MPVVGDGKLVVRPTIEQPLPAVMVVLFPAATRHTQEAISSLEIVGDHTRERERERRVRNPFTRRKRKTAAEG